MTLAYLSSTLTEEEYLEQRFKQDVGTGRTTRAAINNSKYFCLDVFKRSFTTVMEDISTEVNKSQNLDTALLFLQKLVNWSNEDHPHILMTKTVCPNQKPYFGKDVATIKGYISQMRLYMKKVAGIPITSEDVKDYKISYPPEVEKEEAEPLTNDEFRIICDNQRIFRRQMLYRVMKDAEARIGAMVQLRKKHFNLEVRPIQITFPKSIMKKKNGIAYTNIKFVAEEDEAPLLKLLSTIQDDDLVFGTGEEKGLAVNNEETAWVRVLKRVGLTEKYAHSGRYKKNIHSIKAMTFTAAEEAVSETFAHAYGDHAMYTKTYLRWSIDKKVAKFRLLEPHISIYTKTEIIADEVLEKENNLLKEKLSIHDILLGKLAEKTKLETRQLPKEDIKNIITEIMKENGLL